MSIRHEKSGDFDYDVVFTVDMTKATHEAIEALGEVGEYRFETILEVEKNGFGAARWPRPAGTQYGMSKPHTEIYDEISSILFEWQNLCFNNDLLMKKIKVTITVEEVK